MAKIGGDGDVHEIDEIEVEVADENEGLRMCLLWTIIEDIVGV